jgi:hypothetical protein
MVAVGAVATIAAVTITGAAVMAPAAMAMVAVNQTSGPWLIPGRRMRRLASKGAYVQIGQALARRRWPIFHPFIYEPISARSANG